jgi:hypothetical protein
MAPGAPSRVSRFVFELIHTKRATRPKQIQTRLEAVHRGGARATSTLKTLVTPQTALLPMDPASNSTVGSSMISAPASDENDSFFANILTPGSSFHPTFLFFVDFVLAFLAFIFVGLAVISRGNVHFIALFGIVLGLWGSIKWCVTSIPFRSYV